MTILGWKFLYVKFFAIWFSHLIKCLALFIAPQKMKEMNTNLSQALIDKQILLVSTKENV